MSEIKSISVSKEFSEMAKEFHLSWSEAARIGMGIMLGDLGLKGYDTNLNIVRKMRHFQRIAEESSQKVEELRDKIELA